MKHKIIICVGIALVTACASSDKKSTAKEVVPKPEKIFVIDSTVKNTPAGGRLLNGEFSDPLAKLLDDRLKSVLDSNVDRKAILINDFSVYWVAKDYAKRGAAAAMGGLVGAIIYDATGEGRKDSIICEVKGKYLAQSVDITATQACPNDERYCFGTLSNPLDLSLPKTKVAIQTAVSECLGAAVDRIRELKQKSLQSTPNANAG